MEIKVIGAGCDKCGRLYEDVCQAAEELGLGAEIVKVEDLVEMVRLGVMSAPAVMVDGRLVVSGRAPNVKTLKKLLAEQR